jgi:hypothetical protein
MELDLWGWVLWPDAQPEPARVLEYRDMPIPAVALEWALGAGVDLVADEDGGIGF